MKRKFIIPDWVTEKQAHEIFDLFQNVQDKTNVELALEVYDNMEKIYSILGHREYSDRNLAEKVLSLINDLK